MLYIPANSYGHVWTLSSPNHSFFLGILDLRVIQNSVHILSLVTDNSPYRISGREENDRIHYFIINLCESMGTGSSCYLNVELERFNNISFSIVRYREQEVFLVIKKYIYKKTHTSTTRGDILRNQLEYLQFVYTIWIQIKYDSNFQTCGILDQVWYLIE